MADKASTGDRQPSRMKIYFSDFFDVSLEDLQEYGAFNVSLVNDLPLFIDPFLLFNSDKPEYQALHAGIIKYVTYLRDQSLRYQGKMHPARLGYLYFFKEVRQNWLGFSRVGNRGSALGKQFAEGLDQALYTLFSDFGDPSQRITSGSHIEKVCLVSDGVGRDNLSDFTTNLIKEYLLEYTQTFARAHIRPAFRRWVNVDRVRFDYTSGKWQSRRFELPWFQGDYVLLTPKDILTKDDIWINRTDLYDEYPEIAAALPDDQLRYQVNDYFRSVLPPRPKKSDVYHAIRLAIQKFPRVLDYYIRHKEETGEEAVANSAERVGETETFFVSQVRSFVENQLAGTEFYAQRGVTVEEARERALYLKQIIEERNGYSVFYLDGRPIRKESDLQVLHRLVWYAAPPGQTAPQMPEDQNRSPVEFKLGSNAQLNRTFQQHFEVARQNDPAKVKLRAIICFTDAEMQKVIGYLREFSLMADLNIIVIDARPRMRRAASVSKPGAPMNIDGQTPRRRAVILTALQVEYEAVRRHLTQVEEEEHEEGTIYEHGVFDSPNGSWDVWIAEIGAGNDGSAMEAERAIRYATPSVIIFVGVAGGVKDVKLGDVVAASKVYGYESGKADEDGFYARPDVGESTYIIIERAKAERRSKTWRQRLTLGEGEEAPEAHIGALAAGGKVVASSESAIAKFLKNNYNDTLAVEMEGRGILRAARANRGIEALIVRGISDLLDNKAASDRQGWQAKASRNASAFAFEVLAKLS